MAWWGIAKRIEYELAILMATGKASLHFFNDWNGGTEGSEGTDGSVALAIGSICARLKSVPEGPRLLDRGAELAEIAQVVHLDDQLEPLLERQVAARRLAGGPRA